MLDQLFLIQIINVVDFFVRAVKRDNLHGTSFLNVSRSQFWVRIFARITNVSVALI